MLVDNNRNKSDLILEEVKKRGRCADIVDVEEEKTILVIFKLHGDYYAFYGNGIKEILPFEEIAYVPGCPDFIFGIINVRGDIESVLNIHKIMNLAESQTTKDTRIIIAAKDDIRSGILVDSVEDVLDVPVSYIINKPVSTLDKSIREFAVGGERLYGNNYVTILDLGKIFGKILT